MARGGRSRLVAAQQVDLLIFFFKINEAVVGNT